MCRWQEGHGKRAERGPRHRVGNRRRVSKGRQLSMREHGYRRGALGTSISTCLVPGGAAGGGVRRTRTLARQAPSQHPPEFGSSLRAEWSLEHPCPAPPRPWAAQRRPGFSACLSREAPCPHSQSTFKLKGTQLNSSSLCR